MFDWAQYSKVADRFQWKVPYRDREDIKQAIILKIAEAKARDGNRPFTEGLMYRIGSCVVADYWRAEKRRPQAISLNTEIEDGDGNTIELIDTLTDDKAIDVDAWVDARTWLLGCPARLIQIAQKRVSGIPLTKYEQLYLSRCRKKAQKGLF
jgi:DNA-directed RNA polymerase specialized sigma24 family protein